MLEKIAEYDDDLMTKYFDDPSTITVDEIKRALRKATLTMDLVPMICGSRSKQRRSVPARRCLRIPPKPR